MKISRRVFRSCCSTVWPLRPSQPRRGRPSQRDDKPFFTFAGENPGFPTAPTARRGASRPFSTSFFPVSSPFLSLSQLAGVKLRPFSNSCRSTCSTTSARTEPFVSRMTTPLMELAAAVLPFLKSATALGLAAIARRTISTTASVSATAARIPSAAIASTALTPDDSMCS